MFRKAILARLEERGWTQYRLVQESGVSKTAVYEYLAGKRDISASKLEQICDALDLALKKTQKRT